jgi:hypothetical protein
VTSDDAVKIESPGLTLTGRGFEVDVEAQTLRVQGGVHTRLVPGATAGGDRRG